MASRLSTSPVPAFVQNFVERNVFSHLLLKDPQGLVKVRVSVTCAMWDALEQ